jgi:predicted molibdopterin-dependent oxidoreductase YjgC
MSTTPFQITIDNRAFPAEAGETILDVALRNGIEIPTLCHDPRLDPVGACRTCLVEIDGQRRLQPACAFKVTPDMAIQSKGERVERHLTGLLSLYVADHQTNGDLLPHPRGGRNELRAMALDFGPLLPLDALQSVRDGRVDRNPYIQFDPEACIVCGRCTRYCDEVEAVSAITLAGRGTETTVATAGQVSLMDSTCELCGGCIDTCPTSALTEKKSLPLRDSDSKKVRSTCNFCGVGCQLDLNVQNDRIVKVTSPPPGESLNDGNLCVKGRFAYDFIHHDERLQTPLIRREDGLLHPAGWPEAIQVAADGLMGVKKRHGADALGFISSSRCTGEENYLMQKLSRAAFGTNNCHQCAAT